MKMIVTVFVGPEAALWLFLAIVFAMSQTPALFSGVVNNIVDSPNAEIHHQE